MLAIGKRFCVPVGVHALYRGVCLVVAFHVSEYAERERIVAAERLVEAAGTLANLGVVGLELRSVVAKFGEVVSAPEDSSVDAEGSVLLTESLSCSQASPPFCS